MQLRSPHDAPALVRRFPNVVVLRTFSKAYGLAGLRIGYGFGAPDLARTLWTMQLPFGISITSAVAVAASFDAESQLRQRIQYVTSERRYLWRRLRSMGIYTTDSHANFLYLPAAGRSPNESNIQPETYWTAAFSISASDRKVMSFRSASEIAISSASPFTTARILRNEGCAQEL